jgi:hypothetical protein
MKMTNREQQGIAAFLDSLISAGLINQIRTTFRDCNSKHCACRRASRGDAERMTDQADFEFPARVRMLRDSNRQRQNHFPRASVSPFPPENFLISERTWNVRSPTIKRPEEARAAGGRAL